MRQLRIRILPKETLWDALKRENIALSRSCGGKGICGNCQVEITGIGLVKSCMFEKPGEYEVILPEEEEFSCVESVSETAHQKKNCQDNLLKHKLVIGVDLGTTTVVVKGTVFGGMAEKRILTRSFINPQRSYGADVMTRIESAINGCADTLLGLIKSKLYESIAEIVKESGMDREEKLSVVVSGNTTMLHLLRGLSCDGLGKAPFRPVELGLCKEWQEIQSISCKMTYLPGISAFVGGDIVSGIFGLGLMEQKEINLLLDLGTNGEMALVKEGEILVASAAAGPAFEGTPLAMKLHAAGIINLLYFMRKENIMDEYGTLADEYFEDGYPVPEFFEKSDGALESSSKLEDLDGSGKTQGSCGTITQDDIRAIQMAKGAIRAGIDILLKEAGITAHQVSHTYLAGGMGFYLDAGKAVGIGLLPEGFGGRIQVVGNSSLQGALQYGQIMATGSMMEQDLASRQLEQITGNAREIVLANHPEFEERYIENMNFRGELNEDFINCN